MIAAEGEMRPEAAPLAVEYEGPRQMCAGSLARWTLRCRAQAALPAGSRVAVAHRWPSDWGVPQSDNPAGVDYLEVRTNRSAAVRWWNARLHAWHPFDHILFVELQDPLDSDDVIVLHYGAPDAGSPGFRVQTFVEESSPFSLRWQAAADLPWLEFGRYTVEVVGAEVHRLVITGPSRVRAGNGFTLHVRAEDQWGNPAGIADGIEIGEPLDALIHLNNGGWARIDTRIDTPGTYRIAARALTMRPLCAQSNPIDVHDGPQRSVVLWGDLHAQSVIGCGARSIDAYYRHARDFAALDFASHQANCFLVSTPEWQETQTSTTKHNEPGRFITLLGFEWSGASAVGGDHNLYFPGDAAELRRCSHEFVSDQSDINTDLSHVQDLHTHYRGSDTLIAVHVGGRTADLKYHDPTLDRLLEVHSTHATSDWFLFEALRRGYHFGIIAGSDSVDGRPGNSHPGHMGVRNVRGGLTAVHARALTRGALWEALVGRRCYATTGERIMLEFRAGDVEMGDVVVTAVSPVFDVRVEGTAPIETIEFFRGTLLLKRVDLLESAGALSSKVRVGWRGMSAPGSWQRARMVWDGELRVLNARITGVEGWAFDTADEGLREVGTERVAWRSITAGDWDGVILELDALTEAELLIVTAPMNVRTRLETLDAVGRRFEAVAPERCIELKRLPLVMPPESFTGSLTDPVPEPGEHAYWVRVRQVDGAYAWSTPIFVTLAGK